MRGASHDPAVLQFQRFASREAKEEKKEQLAKIYTCLAAYDEFCERPKTSLSVSHAVGRAHCANEPGGNS